MVISGILILVIHMRITIAMMIVTSIFDMVSTMAVVNMGMALSVLSI